MSLNLSKSRVMTLDFTTKRILLKRITFADLPLITSYKYLGITMSHRLTLKPHIDITKKKLFSTILSIRPYTKNYSPKTRMLIFRSLIACYIH